MGVFVLCCACSTSEYFYYIFKYFIIEKHPPQVIITDRRFTDTVRLLVDSKLSESLNY